MEPNVTQAIEVEASEVKPKRFRIGKQMWDILKVLDKHGPLEITEIIMRVEGLHPYRTHYTQIHDDDEKLVMVEIEKPWPMYNQQELDSAIAGESLTCWMGGHEEAREKANKLYASFSRSLRILLEKEMIGSNDRMEGRGWKANRCKFYISNKWRGIP